MAHPTPRAARRRSSSCAGCSGGGDADDDGASLGDTAPPTEVTAPDLPAASPAGTGVVVVGGTTSQFSVTECQLEPADRGRHDAARRHRRRHHRQRRARSRSRCSGSRPTARSAETFTDTISYSDTARILQVQRFEVAGEVSDLRDPDARGTLLRVRPDGRVGRRPGRAARAPAASSTRASSASPSTPPAPRPC